MRIVNGYNRERSGVTPAEEILAAVYHRQEDQP